MADWKVDVYSAPTWADCHAAMEFLSQHNIPYTEHSIEDDGVIEEVEKLAGKRAVPVVKINDQVFVGFSKNRDEIEKLLLS